MNITFGLSPIWKPPFSLPPILGPPFDLTGRCVVQDCFVRSNFQPRSAQRLQHGSIRVLKDLTGYQIKGHLAADGVWQFLKGT